jgi:prefoldin subunit 5
MGDCTSRASNDEISIHYKTTIDRNDFKFYERPNVLVLRGISQAPSLLSDRIEYYEDCIERLKADVQSLLKAIEKYSVKYREPASPLISVEVQKGVDIVSTELCLQACQPYVVVSLEPGGSQQSTFTGQIGLPMWFQTFELQLGTCRYERVVFKVYLTRRLGAPLEYGSVEFSLKDIKDQELRSDWYTLNLKQPIEEARPKLRLRVQMINELGQIIAKLKATSEEALAKTNNAIIELREKHREAEAEYARGLERQLT